MDEYFIIELLWMFSPLLTSMRAMRQGSELDKVQKKLGVTSNATCMTSILGLHSITVISAVPDKLRYAPRHALRSQYRTEFAAFHFGFLLIFWTF